MQAAAGLSAGAPAGQAVTIRGAILDGLERNEPAAHRPAGNGRPADPEPAVTVGQDEQPCYDAAFFQALEAGVARSAEAAAGLILDVIAPRSVVDFGCATGIWLAALRSRGVSDVLGVDGPWVPRDRLRIPQELFREHDLTTPLALDRRYDLALCLETAEHLPAEAAGQLVRTLAAAAPIVIFSAAIPEQRGEGHVNLQWPQYWVDRFAAHGYRCSTVLRERLWHVGEIDVWYRQNLLCFAAETEVPRLGALFADRARAGGGPLDIVHPELFLEMCRNLGEYARYTEQLEGRLRDAREGLQAKEELAQIKATPAYRIYARLRRALDMARRGPSRARAE